MTCCDTCTCIATTRVRQLVNSDQSFDLLLDQQPWVRDHREVWHFGENQSLNVQGCYWRSIAEVDAETRYEVRLWHSGGGPILAVAPLNADDRPLCVHVFSSFSDPDLDYSPPDHEWSIEVTDAGDDRLDIAFRGQHLGYPIPCSSPDLSGTEDGSGRLGKFELLQYASPGQPQVYRLTKGKDEHGNVLSFKLAPWGNEIVPFTFAPEDTPQEIVDELHENAKLPPIAVECARGGLDLYGYAGTLGDASLGPPIAWQDVTFWLTFHEVETPATRTPELSGLGFPYVHNGALGSDEISMFHDRGRIYLWPPNNLDWWYRDFPNDYPHAQPPWVIASGLPGGSIDAQVGDTVASIWLDRQDDPILHDNRLLVLAGKVQITADHGRLTLQPYYTQVDHDAHGDIWIEYRSTEPPDLINEKEYDLTFAGVFAEVPAVDGSTPTYLPLDYQKANRPWAVNIYDQPLNQLTDIHGNPIDFASLTWRVLVTDFGAPQRGGTGYSPAFSTGYTVIADGWTGGDTQTGTVDEMNGEHVIWGDFDSGFVSDNPDWRALAPYGTLSQGYSLIYEAREVPDSHLHHHPTTEPYRINDWWNPSRQYLVAHVDKEHYFYRPKTRAIVSDDPDTLVFEREYNPPEVTWRDGNPPIPPITNVPDEITVRVGPAKVTAKCPECVENQQVTPMAWEATAAGESFLMLRRADCIWSAHLDAVTPHWLPEGDLSLPDPMHERLWVLEGLETLRLYEVPVNAGPRRPIALYRFRPIEHPGPPRVADDPETEDVNESFDGWQKTTLDCISERRLTLWQFGQGYDPARHLLPSHVDLKPIGNNCIAGSVTAEWKHPVNRWEPLDAELLPDDFGLPAVPGTYPLRDERTLCLEFDGPDAGIIWIDDEERWRVFAIGCGNGQLPAVPESPDDGEPNEVRRIRCYTPDPPDPPPAPCRWISNDGVTWEQIDPAPAEACPEGWECRPPFNDPAFAGDVQNGWCEPVSCLSGESTWAWIDVAQDWFLQDSTCPDWCDPVKPGHVGFPGEVFTSTCWCVTCT